MMKFMTGSLYTTPAHPLISLTKGPWNPAKRVCIMEAVMNWKAILAILAGAAAAQAHDVITTKITFDREITRIFYDRCVSCHRDGGSAFSLMTYNQARPWAKAIEEEVLERRMPPYGAIKGFADLREDQALTPEQIELITDWTEGGAPEGDEKDLPPAPKLATAIAAGHRPGEIVASGEFKLRGAFQLDGVWPQTVAKGTRLQITAELPDGSIQPVLWTLGYKPEYGHPFLLRSPILLPKGSLIHGIPADAKVILLPVSPPSAKAGGAH